MSEARFKTMRHIETVRNYLLYAAEVLLLRGQRHDQSKLKPPEVEILEEYTPKLRGVTYGSEEYKANMKGMRPMIEHHNKFNRHHPEHFTYQECNGCFKHFGTMPNVCNVCGYSQFTERVEGVMGMNLFDLVEMLCDWKAAGMRHDDGDIYKSLEINAERFGYPEPIKQILLNTVKEIEEWGVTHYADES